MMRRRKKMMKRRKKRMRRRRKTKMMTRVTEIWWFIGGIKTLRHRVADVIGGNALGEVRKVSVVALELVIFGSAVLPWMDGWKDGWMDG